VDAGGGIVHMTDETLYTDLVTPEKLRELVEACGAANMFPRNTWVLAERIPAYVIREREERQNLLLFDQFPPKISLESLFEKYTTGRIFSDQLELRWEQQGQDIRVVYLGTKKYEFILRDYKLEEREKELDGLSAQQPKSYFLFGQRLRPGDVSEIGAPAQDGDFAEARIPRLLRYPVPYNLEKAKKREAEEQEDGKKRIREYVKLHVREFLDERGSVAFFRFCGLTVKEIQG
jgi:hypothetical protein